MTIEKAHINDSSLLTELTKQSKAYWGYTTEQLILWDGLLTITPAYIDKNCVYKLLHEDAIIGYYSYFAIADDTIQLDNLFLLPEYIGQGFGRLLMQDFLSRMSKNGCRKVVLEADPNAEAFYTKIGFTKTGETETSIKERYLPVMELVLG